MFFTRGSPKLSFTKTRRGVLGKGVVKSVQDTLKVFVPESEQVKAAGVS